MRVALISPYSWSYPGGVTRHISSLADQLMAAGHHVRVLAPYDPPDRMAAWLHRGARPEALGAPDHLISLGRTVGLPANGAVSNVAMTPFAASTLRRELRAGGFDVVHIHEPVAPVPGWDTLMACDLPMVGTFHCYSESRLTNSTAANLLGARRRLNRLGVRIAVSEAAAWTGRRFYGGHYRIVPNGVDLPATALAPAPPSDRLRIAFVGQAVERKGLPVLLRAFEALREHVPASLEIVGADVATVEPLTMDMRGITALGKVSDEHKREVLARADVLAAPSLGGESFGMVLTEAFAQATPVVASDIAGYRDVVRDGVEGTLVPRGDATELAEALRDMWLDPDRRVRMAAAARDRARRFAWPTVAAEVVEAYEDAVAVPVPQGRLRRAALRLGALPADGRPRAAPERLPTLEPAPAGARSPLLATMRRVALAVVSLAGIALTMLALRRIGVDNIARTIVDSSPAAVLGGLALMCASMLLRAVSWHAILRAALPDVRVRRADAVQGTLIGVLMSATLPARLGEPSRALVVARRIGRPRDGLPVVLGTLVSQTLLNIVALVVLGAVMFSTIDVFSGHQRALFAIALAPAVLLLSVLVAPILLRRGARGDGSDGRRARLGATLVKARDALHGVRRGLEVFRQPRLGAVATLAQLGAWGIQWMSCYVLLVALGLDDRAGVGAAAAVLFAVNVTAVLPATPSNLGVFQAACVAVLHAYGVHTADALGYGIILQAVELTTAVVMGMPALVKEGVSWRDVRLRALHASSVELRPRSRARRVQA